MVLTLLGSGFVAYYREPKQAQVTRNEADSCDRCGQEACLMNSKMARLHEWSHGYVCSPC